MIRDGIVRIYDGGKNLAGVGFLYSSQKILTLKSVVDIALSKTAKAADRIVVDFPGSKSTELLIAEIINIYATGSYDNSEIAALELLNPAPVDTQPLSFVNSDDLYGHEFSADGFLRQSHQLIQNYTVWGHLLGIDAVGWIRYQIQNNQNFQNPLGFLGTPVWDYSLNGVVGMFTDISLSEAPQYKFVRQPVKKDGLIMGVNILNSVDSTLLKISEKNDSLKIPDRSRLELTLDSSMMYSLTQEAEYLDSLVNELEKYLFGLHNKSIHVCSVLHPGELVIVLDMPGPVAKKLEDFFLSDSGLKDKYAVKSAKNLYSGTRTQRNVGPALFNLTSPKAPPVLNDDELTESVKNLQDLYQGKIKQMGEVKRKFLEFAVKSIEEWYQNVEQEILLAEHVHTNQLGEKKISQLNRDVQDLVSRVNGNVIRLLERRPELWWHLQHGDQHYILYDNVGRRTPAGEIEKSTREIANEILPLLMSYGYDCKRTLDKHPYEWSIEMKECYDVYEKLRNETAQIYRQYSTMKELKDKNKSIQDAKYKWGKMPKRPENI